MYSIEIPIKLHLKKFILHHRHADNYRITPGDLFSDRLIEIINQPVNYKEYRMQKPNYNASLNIMVPKKYAGTAPLKFKLTAAKIIQINKILSLALKFGFIDSFAKQEKKVKIKQHCFTYLRQFGITEDDFDTDSFYRDIFRQRKKVTNPEKLKDKILFK